MPNLGLYIHIPFCLEKCPYCDFFSQPYDSRHSFAYADAVIRNAEHYKEHFDTIYFGGGTPSAAWWDVCRIMGKLKFDDSAEITIEANPNTLTQESLSSLKGCGVNRISIGVQSFSNAELRSLMRGHTSEDASNAVRIAQSGGFKNISVDLMLGIPNQTPDSVRRSIKILSGLGDSVKHVSAYMLKIEPSTPYANMGLKLPDEYMTSQIYLTAVSALEEHGFMQYEISNFAKPGYESPHNLKYWKSQPYLGIGASAHSYYEGERFYVKNNIKAFIKSIVQETVVTDRDNVNFSDYAMLKLRLNEGLTFTECERFGLKKEDMLRRCKLVPPDYLKITDKGISITKEGFLVSNRIIGKLTTKPAEQYVPVQIKR
ncbi:MAG: radical SAM family heme chaperone HemW [Oscillospiraceae bacterium]|nr:radical SAM family heme chaperone HemW [Oscillospiraceae bacterium]